MCAKDDLIRRKSLLLISMQTSNYVDTFSLDFAFSFAAWLQQIKCTLEDNILSLIAFIISYRLFADKLRSTPSTLLARFIPITKIRDPLLKKNAAKSRILLACADRRIRQCYLTICAILKYYNFNIYVSLATDTLHLLLKGLVIKMLDFMQDILDDIYPSTVVSLLFILKAPFALHFIYASYNKDTLAYIQGALERINIFKEEFRLILGIQPYLIKLPLSEVAVNIAISNFIYAAALYLILIIINYICYDKDRKHIAYIRAFSKILLFNNNRQINNTTRMLSILQAFKFYNLSIIIYLVHLVLRDLPNLITRTTISYYVNNYIN
ncbi:hypothetical protein HBH64_245610 [Parastagonospora nodorum]|nr:hypothetical protein HBH80_187190 [Parastagonospora nodorum]KAH4723604.1 hypothetical protein HBH66_141180 [Parastagonospora nodorum]KAH4736057.1 hypothetical protein HBH64_245610 [Parastagonospora nodorum]KAH4745802.1 hypothetical protein HBH65_201950 [Parastagonospora nodorum]